MARTVSAKIAKAPKRGVMGRVADYLGSPVGERNRKAAPKSRVWPDPYGTLNGPNTAGTSSKSGVSKRKGK